MQALMYLILSGFYEKYHVVTMNFADPDSGNTKTDSSVRTIKLPEQAFELLKAHRKWRREQRIAVGWAPGRHKHV